MHPVVTPDGRAVVAWSAQFVSEGGGGRDVHFQAAVRLRGASRFRRATLLESIPAGSYDGLGRPIDAVLDSTGRVAVAWSGSDGASRRVRSAAVEAAGGFGPRQDVSLPGDGSILSDLAAGPGGRVIAVWDDGVDARTSSVSAALAPTAGAPFGPPEDASPAGHDARFGQAAFDPLSGRPTIVWSNRPEGAGRSVAEIETFAQAAIRSD